MLQEEMLNDSKISDEEIYIDNEKLLSLKRSFKKQFNRLNIDEERTIEYYFKVAESRGLDGYKYVNEAIKRASMKNDLNKPISYIAGLCKNFFKNGLYSQPFQEENDILSYVESRIGKISLDNKKLIQNIISKQGAVRVMAAAGEVLNNSTLQDKFIEEIINRVIVIFNDSN